MTGACGGRRELLDRALEEELIGRTVSEIGDFASGFEGATRRRTLSGQKSNAHGAGALGERVSVEFFFKAVVRQRERIASQDAEFVVLGDVIDCVVVEWRNRAQLALENIGIEAEFSPSNVFVGHLCRFEKCSQNASLNFGVVIQIVRRIMCFRHSELLKSRMDTAFAQSSTGGIEKTHLSAF